MWTTMTMGWLRRYDVVRARRMYEMSVCLYSFALGCHAVTVQVTVTACRQGSLYGYGLRSVLRYDVLCTYATGSSGTVVRR